MNLSMRQKPRHASVDPRSPKAWGVCDLSGLWYNREDLVKEMQWRGNALVWTGYLVGYDLLDTPNEQLKLPILPPDPVPVKMPRTPNGQEMSLTQEQIIQQLENVPQNA